MRRPLSSLVTLWTMMLLHKSKFICTDAYLINQVPHDDSATFESALSWALYWNDQQYVNLSTKTLPRIMFLYNCKFKYWGLRRGSPFGFFNPAIPTGIFPQSRNPDSFYRLIPIPVIFSQVLTSTKNDPWSSVSDSRTADPKRWLLDSNSCISLH